MSSPTGPAENPYLAPTAVLEPQPATHELPPDAAVRALFQQGKNGAAWFYWIAVLSLINTALVFSKGGITFALGLTVTMISDLIAARAALKPGGDLKIMAASLIFD